MIMFTGDACLILRVQIFIIEVFIVFILDLNSNSSSFAREHFLITQLLIQKSNSDSKLRENEEALTGTNQPGYLLS